MPPDEAPLLPPRLCRILRRFGVAAGEIRHVRRPEHAAIAQVWLLDERLVLRARARSETAVAELERELALVRQVRALIPQRLPAPAPARDGRPYVPDEQALWTLYPALPGRILRPWQQLHRAPPAEQQRLVRALAELQRATRGRLSPPSPRWFVDDIAARRRAVQALLPDHVGARLSLAQERVARAAAELTADRCVFVHGDFHWGNLLLDEQGEVAGLLDLDWARVGHPFEDLAYTVMMLLRDYDGPAPRLERLPRLLDAYDPQLGPPERALLAEHLILYALFDVHLFQTAEPFPGRERYLAWQRDMLDHLCRAL